SFARKASCGAVRLTAKPVRFLCFKDFRCKNSLFKRPPLCLALQTKQCFILPLRLALRIKAVLLFLLRLRMTLPCIK
ncbi:hypothetical protein, partial [Acinetobacter sp.]|uniref:hypothetical protein n=1 Tax=Acinetobacter sp. TaxID=472 RepID=UPI002FCBC157